MRENIVVVPDYVYVTKDAVVVRDNPQAPIYWNRDMERFIVKDARGRYARLIFDPYGSHKDKMPVYDLLYRPRTGETRLARSGDLQQQANNDDNEIEQAYYTDIVKSNDEKRYTFGVVYKASNDNAVVEDAHRDFMTADDLQQAQWDYVRSGDRGIFIQHKRPPFGFEKGGEWVDICTLPFEVEGEFKKANGQVEKRSIPANSVWMGTVWEPWSWPLVKDGRINGYSFGGKTQRLFDDED